MVIMRELSWVKQKLRFHLSNSLDDICNKSQQPAAVWGSGEGWDNSVASETHKGLTWSCLGGLGDPEP